MGWDGMGDLPARCAYLPTYGSQASEKLCVSVSVSVLECGVCPRPLD